jgi:PHD/YefM family antitoxin component YafN of YafNO toxin-antitoxin module
MNNIDLQQIHSLTDFLRNHKEHIARIKKTGDPAILTINGKAEIVMVDAESYQSIIEKLRQIETIEAIRVGLKAAEDGDVKPAEQVFLEMKSKYGISD